MKENDYGTRLIFNISDSDGTPIELDEATVVLVVRILGEVTEYDCIADPNVVGRVYYDLEEDIFADSGRLEMELDVTLPSGHWTSNRITEIVKTRLKG